jgi:hypothetical protein
MADKWVALYNLIAEPFQTGCVKEREAKSAKVRKDAQEFVRSYHDWDTGENIRYYMHSLMNHIPDQIQILDMNFADVSGSAVEYRGLDTKYLYRSEFFFKFSNFLLRLSSFVIDTSRHHTNRHRFPTKKQQATALMFPEQIMVAEEMKQSRVKANPTSAIAVFTKRAQRQRNKSRKLVSENGKVPHKLVKNEKTDAAIIQSAAVTAALAAISALSGDDLFPFGMDVTSDRAHAE